MKKIYTYGFLLVFLFLLGAECYAQINRRAVKRNNSRIGKFRGASHQFSKSKRYHYLSFSVNSMNYFGDMAPAENASSTDISFTRPGFTVMWGHRFGPRYTFRTQLTWGTLRGSDNDSADPSDLTNGAYRYVRNLHFRNRITEFAGIGMFDLFENTQTHLNRVQFTPYAFVGIAVFYHNPKAQVPDIDVHNGNSSFATAGEWVALQPLGTEGQNSDLYDVSPYKRIQLAIPFGLGVRYKLNSVLDLSFEVGVRYLFFDYIDDVSGTYVDLGIFDDPVARALSDRSNELYQTGSATDQQLIDQSLSLGLNTYTSTVDGQSYTIVNGFGRETDPLNVRGTPSENDVYVVTSLRVAYILGGSIRRPKFR